MSQYLIQDTTLIALADAIRAKTGTSEDLTLEQMIAAIESMNVQEES
jgi:hypothetical protein